MRHMGWAAAAGIALAIGGQAGMTRAQAATVQGFDQAAFAAAQQAGKPILVHITAPWCPTCAAQKPILAKLEAEPANGALLVFDVDFDTQKDVVRALGARVQSTLIVYHGATEQGRSSGDTQAASIEALVARANG